MPVLKDLYRNEVIPKLMEKYKYKSIMQVPKIEKVTLNVGIGSAPSNPKLLEAAMEELAIITGQRPVKTKAKKSIAAFKIRQGMNIGCMVTLRRDVMWEFLYKLIKVALPRVRDFRGLNPKSFDGRGNYNFSVKEQIIFPEINIDKIESYHGMNITITTTAKTDDEALSLLEFLGFPFRKN
ncbi:MAG: 50S ribosomal protein L5 [Leptospiraceae bacterium]|nr:50S ribosomal protein L5 [Leptospiraceae bacterium]MDW7975183.1 50S ribosomal protein L5 [Leptospiraceae bacterium]